MRCYSALDRREVVFLLEGRVSNLTYLLLRNRATKFKTSSRAVLLCEDELLNSFILANVTQLGWGAWRYRDPKIIFSFWKHLKKWRASEIPKSSASSASSGMYGRWYIAAHFQCVRYVGMCTSNRWNTMGASRQCCADYTAQSLFQSPREKTNDILLCFSNRKDWCVGFFQNPVWNNTTYDESLLNKDQDVLIPNGSIFP